MRLARACAQLEAGRAEGGAQLGPRLAVGIAAGRPAAQRVRVQADRLGEPADRAAGLGEEPAHVDDLAQGSAVAGAGGRLARDDCARGGDDLGSGAGVFGFAHGSA